MQNKKDKRTNRMKLEVPFTSKSDRQKKVKEIMKLPGGEKLLDCIQCGLCAGSCPTRSAMDFSPTQIIKMIQMGMRDEVLSSSALWICSHCHTCVTRCPREVDIPTLMMSLRNMALREKFLDEKNVNLKFHKSFFEIIKKSGKLHEPELQTKIMKKSDIKGLIHNAKLGWRLFRKGKLHLRAKKIQNIGELLTILENIEEIESK